MLLATINLFELSWIWDYYINWRERPKINDCVGGDQIHKTAGCACAVNAGNVFSTFDFNKKPQVSAPGIYHDTYVKNVPWCISGSLSRGGGETFLAFPAHAQPAILHIWQEAHCSICYSALNNSVDTRRIIDGWDAIDGRSIYHAIKWSIPFRIPGNCITHDPTGQHHYLCGLERCRFSDHATVLYP